MSNWKAAKAKKVLAALEKIGWQIKRQKGSHITLSREGWSDYIFAFHDGEEIGSKMMSRIAKIYEFKYLIINGFCKEFFRELPMEYAVEAQKLLGLKLEGSVG